MTAREPARSNDAGAMPAGEGPPEPRPRKRRAAWRFGGVPVDDRPAGDITCRNCGADAPGAYCPACGQETALRLPGAGRFMREAAGRYVAFDGRMWRTLFALLFRPGFLTREYLAGRRKRYVRPARLVLVLAIALFAAVRLTADPDEVVRFERDSADGAKTGGKAATAAAPAPTGKSDAAPGTPKPAPAAAIVVDGDPLTIGSGAAGLRIDEGLNLHLVGVDLPLGERVEARLQSFNALDRERKARELVAGMLRYGPYALIAMLPAFALLMKLLYLGRGRRYPERPRRYAEHLVYGAHNHAFVALVGTLAFAIQERPLTLALVAWTAAYLPWSMSAVYGGRWSGVFARAAVAVVAYVVIFALAVIGLLLAAVVLR